ncbi:Mu transposase C-terminal domain-containing protein [Epilithonimonas mollis]|uniref:Integrase core domain-containing protein n=1 Tax=Epilithonimonas mollis TaxID=216903 RepID=A0A1M6UJ13_9FLAO|nr:Mu transposase C-terminal domain-containing protein [Epilithonimonas mollis]SHK69212.1 Integrase core domain-containing protein [Epilithonimonas mollis]
MNLQPTDIIIRQANGSESLWVSQRLVTSTCDIDENYLKVARIRYKDTVRKCDLAKAKDFMPDSGKSWRFAKQYGQFYYCISNVPNKAPKNYRNYFGDQEVLLDQYKKVCKSKEAGSLELRFKAHLKRVSKQYWEFYTDVNEIQRLSLSKACAVLDFILDEKENYPGTANKIYKDLSPILSDLDLQYIPHNYLKLKEKITILETTDKSIVDIIHLPRVGNNYAEIYNDAEVFSWVMQLRSMPQNYSNEHIIRKVSEMCEMTTKRQPSRRWYGQNIFELPKTKFLTGEKRFGSSSSKSHIHKSYIPTQNALFAGDCWEMDATRVNFIAHEADDNKERFLFVVAVRDVHSGDVLGYSFDYSENHVVYLEAMKMAVQNAGYLPYEWITDRFPGHNTPNMLDFFERMENQGVQVTFSSNANEKAGIERWFRTLQSVFFMDSKYFYGEGIKSRADYAHRAPEYLKRIKKEAKKTGWDMQQNIDEASVHIEKYRNTRFSHYSRKHSNVHLSPSQIHEISEKPHVNYVSLSTISMLFGQRKAITIKHDGQISTEIVKVQFDYMISPANYDIISNYFGKQVVMTYDLNDLSHVFLWEKQGKLLKSLCDADLFERPQLKGPNKEFGKLAIAKERAKAIAEMKETELAEMIGEEAGMMGIYTEKSKATAFEDQYNDEYKMPLKKASGDGISSDDVSDAFFNNISNQY